MEQYLLQEINNDIKRRIDLLYRDSKYKININNDELYNKCKLREMTIFETQEKTLRGPHKIAKDSSRCQGRIWGNCDTTRVRKDSNGDWIYGFQCKRQHQPNEIYCGMHLKSLTHGNFFEIPPHQHFERFKQNSLCGE
jgi:hypothetical protein